MKTKLGFLVLTISILTSCGSGQLKTTEITNDEAIIIGRAFINNDGQLVEKKWNFLWDERLWGKKVAWVDENGFMFMKIPKGKHFISLLHNIPYSKNIPDNLLSIEVDGNKIYYIGDITFIWNISDKDIPGTGIVGAIADSKKKVPSIEVDVKDNFEETKKHFNEKFGNSRTIEKQLIKVMD